jgi:hypothetical protein
MSRRSRIVGFGSAALLVVVGGVCAVVLSGLASDLALGVLGLGAVLAVSLVFLEVGLSEDRERAREQAARAREEEKQRRPPSEETGRPPRLGRARLGRTRGHPRRLR